MIIRLTVGDNDFSLIIEKYFKDFYKRLTGLIEKEPSYTDYAAWIKMHKRYEEMNQLLNPNVVEKHTKEQKNKIIERVTKTFGEYVSLCTGNDTAEYLKENLEVTIIDTMTDCWENGEAWYWFQHSGVVVNQ